MEISIIILNYNTFEYTSNCIRSVYKFTKEISFEIILVDNASEECDAELFKKEFPGIILIKNKENVGFAKGNNIGICHSKGKYVLLLNSDTMLANNAIFIAFKKLDSNNKIGAISVMLQYPDGKVQHQCNRFPSVFRLLAEHLRLHKLLPAKIRAKLYLSTYFDHNSYIEPDSIWGTFFMFRRDILKKLPGKKLNDDFFMYYEDLQWCKDIKKLGYCIAYEPSGTVIHFTGKSNASRNELFTKNHIIFLKKNYNFIKAFLLKLLWR